MLREAGSVPAKQLTNSGLDHQPSLSFGGTLVVFVRDTPARTIESPTGDKVPATELWVVDVRNEKLHLLLRGGDAKGSNGVPLANFANPQFALDDSRVYFLTQAAVVSGAVYSADIETRSVKELCAGNSLQVIRSGQYAGDLVVEQHRYFMGGGSYDWVYVLTPDGEVVGTLGERGSPGFEERLRDVLGETERSDARGTPPNHRVNPPVRTVTGLAKSARPAPAQPAGYAEC